MLFDKRTAYKPFEYPETMGFVKAINHSYWVHSELDFTSDVQEYHTVLTKAEKSAVKRSLLSISQIEVNVKSFWGNLFKHIPKPEFNNLGMSFGECHIEGTEVLTKSEGWVDFRNLTENSLVATFDDNREIFFEKPSALQQKAFSGNMLKISNQKNLAIITPNHRIAYYNKNDGYNELKYEFAKDHVFSNSNLMMPVSTGISIKNELEQSKHLTALDKLKIAIQADGCIRYWRNAKGERFRRGSSTNSQSYEIKFTKKRKIDRLKNILHELPNVHYTEHVDGRGYTAFDIHLDKTFNYKTFDWVLAKDVLTKDWCRGFVAELSHWDGHYLPYKKKCKIKYSSTSKACADIAQMIGLLAGYRTHIVTSVDNRSETFNDCFTVSFTQHLGVVSGNSYKKEDYKYEGVVYCATMSTGNLITRYKNKVLFSGNSEVRHSEAYSELLTVLGLEESFNNLLEVPVMKERVEYLSKALTLKTDKKQDYVLSLILFSILIENVSLFSQFAILLAFTRFKGIMMSISNVIAYTAFEEQIHGKGGVYIINLIKKEYPELFTEELYDKVRKLIEHSIGVESRMLDWIFEKGEIDSVSKKDLLFFMKDRVDVNLTSIGMDKMYNVSTEDLKPMFWFNEEVTADTLDDFFAKKPVDYSKHDKPISANDLF